MPQIHSAEARLIKMFLLKFDYVFFFRFSFYLFYSDLQGNNEGIYFSAHQQGR